MTGDDATLAPGDVVAGRFRIASVLGEGGMGTVYRALQLSLDREVALKIAHRDQVATDVARRRFLREARVAAALHHPNAVEIYDFGEADGTLFLAMELLRGIPLRAIVDVDLPPIELRRACRIARQVADVLAAAEGIQLVHRDLKPENVMLEALDDGGERVIVVDFGLAFREEHTPDTGRITRDGMSSGTPDYMSPEQVRGTGCTAASDVYALGCILYEMLTAHSPIATPNAATTMMRHLFTVPTPMREAFPELDVPAELDEVTQAMLRKHPSERPTAVAVRDVLLRHERAHRERMGATTDAGRAVGRSSRMLSMGPAPSTPTVLPVPSPDGGAAVHFSGGEVDDELASALAANGFSITRDAKRADVLVVLGADLAFVEERVRSGRPVVAEVDPSDPDRLSSLLRLGVAEVFPAGAGGPVLVKRLERAIRKSRRSSTR